MVARIDRVVKGHELVGSLTEDAWTCNNCGRVFTGVELFALATVPACVQTRGAHLMINDPLIYRTIPLGPFSGESELVIHVGGGRVTLPWHEAVLLAHRILDEDQPVESVDEPIDLVPVDDTPPIYSNQPESREEYGDYQDEPTTHVNLQGEA